MFCDGFGAVEEAAPEDEGVVPGDGHGVAGAAAFEVEGGVDEPSDEGLNYSVVHGLRR